MATLGYDINDVSADTTTPSGIGNVALPPCSRSGIVTVPISLEI